MPSNEERLRGRLKESLVMFLSNPEVGLGYLKRRIPEAVNESKLAFIEDYDITITWEIKKREP